MKTSYQTLSRIEKIKIDDERKKLSRFLREEEKLETELKVLNREFEGEKSLITDTSTIEEQKDFTTYLKAYLEKKSALEENLKQTRAEIERIKDIIANMFKDKKTFDIVDDNFHKRIEKEISDKEQKTLDEIGTNKYIKSSKK